jgi:large subunit ribosomal protein L29
MKASQIRDFDDKELDKHLAEIRQEVFGLRFSNATGELDDTAALPRAKRDLARTLTVAREKQLAAEAREDVRTNQD